MSRKVNKEYNGTIYRRLWCKLFMPKNRLRDKHITLENKENIGWTPNTTKPPDYENSKNGFRNIEGIQRYRFTLFLSCL